MPQHLSGAHFHFSLVIKQARNLQTDFIGGVAGEGINILKNGGGGAGRTAWERFLL